MSALSLLSSIVLTLTPFVLYPVCQELAQDGTRMKCFYSGIFITIMGILIMLCLVLSYLGKLPNISLAAASVLAFMSWLIPHEYIGLCANPEHSCRASTMPHAGVCVIVIIMLSVLCMIFGFILGKDKQ